MRTILQTTLAVLICVSTVLAQAPKGFNYQGVVKDKTGQVLSEQTVSLQISILEYTDNGNAVYTETHQVTTTENGLFAIVIGKGTAVAGSFANINWGDRNHYTKIEIDPTGGTNYESLGTSQLLSVPYAMYATKAGQVDEVKDNKRVKINEGNNVIHSNGAQNNNNTNNPAGTLEINPINTDNPNTGVNFQNTVINPDGGKVAIGAGRTNAGPTFNTNYALEVLGGIHTDSIQITKGAGTNLVLTSVNNSGKAEWKPTQDDQNLTAVNKAGNNVKIAITDGKPVILNGGTNVTITNPNDSTITINATAGVGSDVDWLKTNGNTPTSINDTIYTMGRVGIGTNNPQNNLHIDGGFSSTGITLNSNGQNSSLALAFTRANVSQFLFQTTANHHLFRSINTNPFRYTFGGSGTPILEVNTGGTATIGNGSYTGNLTVNTMPINNIADTLLVKGTNGLISKRALSTINASNNVWWKAPQTPADSIHQSIYKTGNIGIGRQSPSGSVKLHTYSNNAINGNNIWHVADGGSLKLQLTSYSTAGNGLIEFRDARGTEQAPTATQAGDIIGQILANGRDNTQGIVTTPTRQNGFSRLGDGNASIKFEATRAFTAISTPTQISFYTTPINSDTAKARLRILDNGDIIALSGNFEPGTRYGQHLGSSNNPWNIVYRFSSQQSDMRLKENISNLPFGLNTIMQLNPKQYNFIDDPQVKTQYGLIAQDVQSIIPDLIEEGTDVNQTLSLNYIELIPILINSIKELKAEINSLENRLNAIEEE